LEWRRNWSVGKQWRTPDAKPEVGAQESGEGVALAVPKKIDLGERHKD